MKKYDSFEGIVLSVLSLMLVCVFVLSVYMYDDIANNAENGRLSAVAASVRDFIDENETVAAFLGIDSEGTEESGTDIAAEAAAYIARYNEIYAHLE